MKPIKPSEVQGKKDSSIPPEIIEAFNELIVENWNGSSAAFKQKDAVGRIRMKLDMSSEDLFKNNYLDIEPLFRKAGWKVEFDKAGFNETYDSFFVFSTR